MAAAGPVSAHRTRDWGLTVALGTIRTGIKTNIAADANFAGWTIYDVEPRNPMRPCAIVGWPDTYDPRGTYGGNIDLVIPVRFEQVWRDDQENDTDLMAAMDNAVAAIESDRTLGGACDDLAVGSFSDIGVRGMPDDTVVAQFSCPVEIMA